MIREGMIIERDPDLAYIQCYMLVAERHGLVERTDREGTEWRRTPKGSTMPEAEWKALVSHDAVEVEMKKLGFVHATYCDCGR